MHNSTTAADFTPRLEAGRRVVPVLRGLLGAGGAPVGVYRKLAIGKPGTFLLESAEQGGIWSRFSFVGVGSLGVLTQGRADDGTDRAVWLDYGVSADRALGSDAPAAPLEALAHLYTRWRTPHVD